MPSVIQTYCIQCGTSVEPEGPACRRCAYHREPGEDWERDSFIGRTINDRYRALERLGQGNFGVIYKVVHLDLGSERALKRPHDHIKADADSLDRFKREASILASLNHPNVLRVEDFGSLTDGRPYLVLELVEGETVAEVLERERTLKPLVAVDFVKQAARALVAAHGREILHRDLKPGNLMITQVPGFGAVLKVVDFGIARLREGGTITRAGMAVGTPNYMAPEQWDSEPQDLRSDLYSLGVCLYRMLTGELPFGDLMGRTRTTLEQSRQALIKARNEGSPPPDVPRTMGQAARLLMQAGAPPPSSQRPGVWVPPVLDLLVADLLHPSTDLRVQSAQDLIWRLEEVEQALSRPPGQEHAAPAGMSPAQVQTIAAVPPGPALRTVSTAESTWVIPRQGGIQPDAGFTPPAAAAAAQPGQAQPPQAAALSPHGQTPDQVRSTGGASPSWQADPAVAELSSTPTASGTPAWLVPVLLVLLALVIVGLVLLFIFWPI